jgi:eukaryotic-like serine/threonine-protein kinase
MQLAAGALVGSYEILGPLGAGGMGEVYRARDPRIGREVAIKILPSSFSGNADRLRRFEQEARAAGVLNHPNLLTVFELGTHAGAPFIVSELLEGWTLREVLNGHSSITSHSSDGTPKGAVPAKRAIEFAVQLANGLAAAHDKQIIHRDLKPENVLVMTDSRVKLLDFGLAKLLDDAPFSEENTINKGTHPGLILGTVAYMSPEQVRGEAVDHRSDIFALGSVLYEMLSGAPPFRRDAGVETMNAILNDDPKPIGFVPPALERIVHHAMEKNPARRFGSMRDLAFALETLSGSGESAVIDGKKKAPAKKVLEKTSAVFHRLTFRRGFLMNARFANDGSIIYGAAWDDQPIEVYSTVAGTRHSRSVGLPGADILSISGSGEIAVSLGRRYLHGWVSSGTLARIPLFGGAPREICEDVQEAEWGPDGKSFLILRRAGEGFRIEYPIGNVIHKSMTWMSHPRFSPKGDMIAFFDHPLFGDDRGSLVVIDLEGHERFRSDVFPSTGGVAWSPRGDEVWIARERAETGRDIVAFTLSGKERTLLAAPGRYSLFDISKDGTLLLSFDYCRREIMAGKIGNQHDQNLSWFDWSFLTSITPDGSRIVFEEQGAFSRADGEYQIYVRSLDGSPSVSIGEGYGRAISADGKWVAAMTGTPPRMQLLPTGAGDPRPVPLRGLESCYTWDFSPDNERMFILGNEPGHGIRIFSLELGGDGTPQAISPEGASAPMAVAPDGRHVVANGPDHRMTIYAADDSEPRTVKGCLPGERVLAWSNDGGAIFVTGQGRTSLEIIRVNLESGERSAHHTIRPADPGGIMDLSPARITPDGQTYAYGYRRYLSDLFVVTGLR